MNMVALVDGQPRLLNLKEMLEAFLAPPPRSGHAPHDLRAAQGARARATCSKAWRWRWPTSTRSSRSSRPRRRRPRRQAALMARALGARRWCARLLARAGARCVDAPGRTSPPSSACSADGYRLSEAQAQAILEMRLQRLTGLEQDKIIDGIPARCWRRSPTCSTSSRDPSALTEVIARRARSRSATSYGDARRTEIDAITLDLDDRGPDRRRRTWW